jgi:hypothetical protein
MIAKKQITKRIWLRAFGILPKFPTSLGTSDTLSRYMFICTKNLQLSPPYDSVNLSVK